MKATYEYEVQGFYAGQWELVTTEETREDANDAAKTYLENERGTSFRVKRVPVTSPCPACTNGFPLEHKVAECCGRQRD